MLQLFAADIVKPALDLRYLASQCLAAPYTASSLILLVVNEETNTIKMDVTLRIHSYTFHCVMALPSERARRVHPNVNELSIGIASGELSQP